MKTIRCSQLPILAECLGMLGEDYTAVSVTLPAATEGSLIHAQIAHWIKTGEEPDDGQPTYRTLKMFKKVLTESEYKPRFKLHTSTAAVEEELLAELGGCLISGHPDLFGLLDPELSIDLYDWKTGWNVEGDHVDQLKGYAYILFELYNPNTIRAIIIRRDCTAQMWVWTQDDLLEWGQQLAARLENWDGKTFRTGKHCQYCPRRLDCPAHRHLVRAAVSAFSAPDIQFDLTDPATCIKLWNMSGVVEKAVSQVRDLIKIQLKTAGDEGLVADGERIYLQPQTKRTVDPVQAWYILEDEIGQEPLAGCVNIGLTKLETALRAVAPRGEKENNVQRVMNRLKEANALVTEWGTPRVTIKKVENQ